MNKKWNQKRTKKWTRNEPNKKKKTRKWTESGQKMP